MLNVFVSQGKDPQEDLLFEGRLLQSAAEGVASLFMYSWDDPVLVLGRSQGLGGIDDDYCYKRAIPVVRRQSGGTGVLQRADLNISLVLPLSHPWARTIHGLYAGFLDAVEGAMARLEIDLSRPVLPLRGRYERSPICFEDHAVESLLFEGKKTLGCAQARKKNAVLVHGTLLFGFDPELYARVFRVSRERVEAAITSVPETASVETAITPIMSCFSEALNAEPVVSAPALAPRPRSGAPFASSARR